MHAPRGARSRPRASSRHGLRRERPVDDGFQGVVVDEGLVALVRLAQRLAQEGGGDPGYAAAGAEEQFASGVGEEGLGRSCGLQAVFDHGAEEVAIERLEVDLVHDTHRQRGVLLHAQVASQRRQPDEPHREQVAAVEGEVQEARQVDEEGVRGRSARPR